MGKRVDLVKGIIEEYENNSKKLKESIDKIDIELKPYDLHIERLKEQLENMDFSTMTASEQKRYEEEFNKQIEETEKEKSDKIAEKDKILKELESSEKENPKSDETRATLTQENIKLDKDIKKTQVKMDSVLVEMDEFEYQYEEGTRTPTNGAEFKKLNDKYTELVDEMSDLKNAKSLCEEKLAEFKKIDEEKVAGMNEVLQNKAEQEKNKEPDINKAYDEAIEEDKLRSDWDAAIIENKVRGIPKNKLTEPDRNYGAIDLKPNPIISEKPYTEYMENRTSKIMISEKEGRVMFENAKGEMYEFDLEGALRTKKEIYKVNNIKAICKEATGSAIMGFFLRRKINPAIIKALNSNSKDIKEYIETISDGAELKFDLTHDLTDSKLGWLDKFKMRMCAKAEEISGAKVIGGDWNKNKALTDGKGNPEKDDDGSKKKTLAENIKVENKNNDIEQKAAKTIAQVQAQMAREIQEQAKGRRVKIEHPDGRVEYGTSLFTTEDTQKQDEEEK